MSNFNQGFNFINQDKKIEIELVKYYFVKQCSK